MRCPLAPSPDPTFTRERGHRLQRGIPPKGLLPDFRGTGTRATQWWTQTDGIFLDLVEIIPISQVEMSTL